MEDEWTEEDTRREIDADRCPSCGKLGFATGGCDCDLPVDRWGRPLDVPEAER